MNDVSNLQYGLKQDTVVPNFKSRLMVVRRAAKKLRSARPIIRLILQELESFFFFLQTAL